MAARILIASILALAIAYAASEDVQAEADLYDLFQCDSKPGDITLAEANIVDEGHYLGKVGIDFIYPSSDSTQIKVIHCIMVKDLIENGSDGTATITDGGLNENNVTIHLASAFSKGINFSVKIMGR